MNARDGLQDEMRVPRRQDRGDDLRGVVPGVARSEVRLRQIKRGKKRVPEKAVGRALKQIGSG